MIIKRGNRRAILELSSSSVKLLIGPSGKARGINSFTSMSEKTSTTEGLLGDRMNLGWYEKHVLPEIIKFKNYCDESGVSDIKCICTAVYRKSSNRNDIFNLIQEKAEVNPILLSGEEEAELAPMGFEKTSNIGGWKLFIDQGRGSTELTLKDPRGKEVDSFSIPYGNNDIRTAINKEKFIEKVVNLPEVKRILQRASKVKENLEIIGSGGILTKNLGYKHLDKISLSVLEGNEILGIFSNICRYLEKLNVITNCADSTYGAWFKYFDK